MTLGFEYLILAFSSCCGVLQIASARSGLSKMMYFTSARLSAIFGLVIIVTSFLWFFGISDRNLPDTDGGIPGTTQFFLFMIGACLSITFTAIVTSFNGSDETADIDDIIGLPRLRSITFYRSYKLTLAVLWNTLKKLIRKYSYG